MKNVMNGSVVRNVDAFGSWKNLGRRICYNITHYFDAYVEAQRQWKNYNG